MTVNKLLRTNKFVVSRRCSKLIRSLNTASYDNRGGLSKPSGEDWTHSSDAVGYCVYNLDPAIIPKHSGGLSAIPI